MTTLEHYLGIGKPDEKAHVEVKTNPVQTVANAYKLWIKFVEKHQQLSPENLFLEEAERMLSPFDAILPDRFDKEYFKPIDSVRDCNIYRYSGIFYTALLNIGSTERKITVPNEITIIKDEMSYFGYKLKKGTLELYARDFHAGEEMQGGTLIYRGWRGTNLGQGASGGLLINESETCWLGQNAKDTKFINKGKAQLVGIAATNCFFENHGEADNFGQLNHDNCVFVNYNKATEMGINGRGLFANFGMANNLGSYIVTQQGLYINFGIVTECFGAEAKEGIFIAAHPPDPPFHFDNDEIRTIPQAYLHMDHHLGRLVENIRHALLKADKLPVDTLSHKIQDYCKKHCNWKEYLKAMEKRNV